MQNTALIFNCFIKKQYFCYVLLLICGILNHHPAMKHKTVKEPGAHLLASMNSGDKQFFTLSEAYELMPDSSRVTIRSLVSHMVSRGLLMRIKDGLYHIIPYDKDPENYQPDWHSTAVNLVDNADYYIGYYSALALHSLITQPALKEQIVVNKNPHKKSFHVKNIEFQFIYHNEAHFFGAKNTWIDNYTKIKCSDVEKTVIDCLFIPEYGGGIVEIAKAVFKAKEDIDFNKLYDYVVKFNSQAVIKRLGYLLETLELDNPVVKKLYEKKTKAFTLLDPSLPKEGKMLSRWSIQQNIDIETIKSALSH